MRVRPLRDSDIPILKRLAESSGFEYPTNPSEGNIEAVLVVEDEDATIVMACAAERLVQLYLWADPDRHPAAKLGALRLLHTEMSKVLREKGYHSVEAFLPPSIAKQFGRRLERTFSWVKNWPSWTIWF